MSSDLFIQTFDIRHPIMMAPMFLVSNETMIKAAVASGIAGVFPALNFRKEGELKGVLDRLQAFKAGGNHSGNFGVNLIVQRTNKQHQVHLSTCVEAKVPFYITSQGDPEEVIQAAHSYGARVLCDVSTLKHAENAARAGCDGFVAVGAGAGGHAGPYPLNILLPSLRKAFPDKFLIAAGGMAHGRQIAAARVLGADAVSVGTRFIASPEAGVAEDYKSAILGARLEDIVLSEKLSGVPCNIINTPYARKIGHKQSWLERQLSHNPRARRTFRKLRPSLLSNGYLMLWSAGQSVEMVEEVLPVDTIVQNLLREYQEAIQELGSIK